MNTIRTAGLLTLIGLTGCGAKPPKPSAAAQPPAGDGGTVVTGVVQKVEVGGGCWKLLGSDSTSYELRADQAPADVLVDQKQVTVTLKLRPDLMSTCMVGKIADVVR